MTCDGGTQQMRSCAYEAMYLAMDKTECTLGLMHVPTTPSGLVSSAGALTNLATQFRICFSVVQGYLRKRSRSMSANHRLWPKRFFVLTGLTLAYWNTDDESRKHYDHAYITSNNPSASDSFASFSSSPSPPIGVYPLADIASIFSPLTHDDVEFTVQLASGKTLQLACDTVANCREWIATLERKGIPRSKEPHLVLTEHEIELAKKATESVTKQQQQQQQALRSQPSSPSPSHNISAPLSTPPPRTLGRHPHSYHSPLASVPELVTPTQLPLLQSQSHSQSQQSHPSFPHSSPSSPPSRTPSSALPVARSPPPAELAPFSPRMDESPSSSMPPTTRDSAGAHSFTELTSRRQRELKLFDNNEQKEATREEMPKKATFFESAHPSSSSSSSSSSSAPLDTSLSHLVSTPLVPFSSTITTYCAPPIVTVDDIRTVDEATIAIRHGASVIGFELLDRSTMIAILEALPAHIVASLYTDLTTAAKVLDAVGDLTFHSVCLTQALASEKEYDLLRRALHRLQPPVRLLAIIDIPSGGTDSDNDLLVHAAVTLTRFVDTVVLDCTDTTDWKACKLVKDAVLQAYATSHGTSTATDAFQRVALRNVVPSSLKRALEVVQPTLIHVPFPSQIGGHDQESHLALAMTTAGHHGPTPAWNTLKTLISPYQPIAPGAAASVTLQKSKRSRNVVHVVLQSDRVQPQQQSSTTKPMDPLVTYLQSNDLIHHPSNLVGVSLSSELSEFATWTCTDSSIADSASILPSATTSLSSPSSSLSSSFPLLDPVLSSSVASSASVSTPTKLFQDYRGEYLSCSNDGSLYLSKIATHESHWKLHKRRSCQLIESFAYKSWFIASEPSTLHLFIYDAKEMIQQTTMGASLGPYSPTAASALFASTFNYSSVSSPSSSPSPLSPPPRSSPLPSRFEDHLPFIRWKVCFAVIQGDLNKRGNIATPRDPTQAHAMRRDEDGKEAYEKESTTGDGFVTRFCWLAKDSLSYWRTAADVHPLPPLRTYPYSDILNVLVDPVHPCRFDIILLSTGERVEFRADSPWQKQIWVKEMENKGVTVRQQMTHHTNMRIRKERVDIEG